jgi:hypothetical protein
LHFHSCQNVQVGREASELLTIEVVGVGDADLRKLIQDVQLRIVYEWMI